MGASNRLVAAALFLCVPALGADTVELSDGSTVAGRVSILRDGSVEVWTAKGLEAVTRERLRRILPDGAGEDTPVEPPVFESSGEALPEAYSDPNAKHGKVYLEDLKGADATLQIRAVRAIGQLKHSAALEPLLDLLMKPAPPGAVRHLHYALHRLDRGAVLRSLRRRVSEKMPSEQAHAALDWCFPVKDAQAARCAIELYYHMDPGVSTRARSFLVLRRKVGVPALLEVGARLRGENLRMAARLLGEIGDPAAVPWLASLCSEVPDDNPDRDAAMEAIGKIGLPGAPALVTALAGNNSKWVCVALQRMSGKPYTRERSDQWKAWLKDNRRAVEAASRARFPEDYK